MKIRSLWLPVMGIAGIIVVSFSCTHKNKFTRGVGIYPGNPAEHFAPDLKPDKDNYRNIARLRPAYHSSSYDYNLTAQLITDGIVTGESPTYISLTTNEGITPKNEREWVLDHVRGSALQIRGNDIWLEFAMGGNDPAPEITSIVVNGQMTYDDQMPGGWRIKLSGSNDDTEWEVLYESNGSGLPGNERPNPFRRRRMQDFPKDSTGKPIDPFEAFWGPRNPGEPSPSFQFDFGRPEPTRIINQVFILKKPVAYKMYRAEFTTQCGKTWEIGDVDFFSNDTQIEMAPSHKFKSAWMSAGTGVEWVYVDLGSYSVFDRIKLHWINKAVSGSIQTSVDARKWTEVVPLPESTKNVDDIALENETSGRYIRILMNKPAAGQKYILSELEVMGKGGLVTIPHKAEKLKDGKMYLAGGNWKIQRSSLVSQEGAALSQPGYECADWVTATVPATVLVSYLNAGAIPNPNYANNQFYISESFFNDDFWYRNEFDIPSGLIREHLFLNFDGINWKADVFVNGQKAGRIEGAFIRGKFDITGMIKPGKKNAIAVRVFKNDHFGTIKEQTAVSTDKNGGILGADNPTYHASIGWDWIPTIRGRNMGIWNDVFLSASGAVTIKDPFIYSDLTLPDTSVADLFVEVTVQNENPDPVKGTLVGKFGEIAFEEKITLAGNESKTVKLDPSTHPGLRIQNPRLWWPKGYGEPNLYDVELEFKTDDNKVSDVVRFKSGIREMRFTEDDQILKMFINGRRFIARGGNWGFPESNLAYRGREYDIAVAYHADMNFTMIRNWVGQTGDEEFFEACDRHGIMVWQDFCLANPADGPDPYDPKMFLENAEDVVRKIRNHPSIGIYVGRNEGNPPEVIDTALRSMISGLHKGLHYISNSSMGVVSGGGPYRALPVKDYYLLYGRNKLHSERGMPNVMNIESLEQTIPDSALWPQNSMWGLHNYTLESAQSCASFNEMVEKGFGLAENGWEFTKYAQWINYDGYRAMFEGRSQYRQGLLLWMSHSAWPSMVWQTYDYYFDPTAAYFGCKKASEPIHIQWNPVYNDIEVVNLNGRDRKELKAKAQIFNMDGSLQWQKEKVIDSNEDTTDKIFRLEFPATLTSVHFIKLTLTGGGNLISENFYWRGLEEGNYQALSNLPKVELESNTKVKQSGDSWLITTTLENTAQQPVLMIRLQVMGKEDKVRILPAFYSDNYISLMPGEKKVIRMRVKNEDTRGEKPAVKISGFNKKSS